MNTSRVFKILLGIFAIMAISVGIYYLGSVQKNDQPQRGVQEVDQGKSSHKNDLIQVTAPSSNAVVASPLTIEGQARGTWYFEASFPIRLLDANGKELGVAIAQAQGEWMTEAFVPFKTQLIFSSPTTETGTLVFQKDNPSGLPEYEDELRIPVQFSSDQQSVILYYYNPEKDKDAQGNILCSYQGLVAVERSIPQTGTPIQDTIRLLLMGNLTPQEKAGGVTTEYPLPGVQLKGASFNKIKQVGGLVVLASYGPK